MTICHVYTVQNAKTNRNRKHDNSHQDLWKARIDPSRQVSINEIILRSPALTQYSNIKKYHEKQLDGLAINNVETTKGVTLWSEFKPIDTVGLYIPGGTAPLFSSVLMQAIPAIIAGCKNIVVRRVWSSFFFSMIGYCKKIDED